MFDIGFFELLVVGIVGLLVIGPERLPETVRTVALWFGRFKQSISETRAELEKQVGADEIRRQLHNERIMKQLRDTRDDVNRTLNSDILKTPAAKSTTADEPSNTIAPPEPSKASSSDASQTPDEPRQP